MEVQARRGRKTSPDRARAYLQPKIRLFKKVQVLYYLSRNGQFEHPHFMEVSYLTNQQLRLKDVLDRLTVLRGKGMPELFSWSCKRMYKNGYVWNDLAKNDVIYPANESEYVLKGCELIEGCTERFQQLQVTSRQQNPELNFHPKRKVAVGPQYREPEEVEYMREEEEEEEKQSLSSSHTPLSRCSRGVSTEGIEKDENQPKTQNNPTELTLDDASPPSTSSTNSEKAHENTSISQRFEYSDSVSEPTMTRNTVLLQLIACGSSVVTKGRNVPCLKCPSNAHVRKSVSLQKDVLRKTVAKMVEEDEINYMSENPRFGNPQSEEKEYFSGSIVESLTEDRVSVEPGLKKSSSYKEERKSLRAGVAEAMQEKEEEEEEREKEKGVKGKCIPRKKSSSSKK